MPEPESSPNRRSLNALRTHLIATSVTATSCFAAIMALSIFMPLVTQMDQIALDSEAAIGLAEHFLFLHSAFWPLVLMSLVACIVTGTILYQRMRAPLVRFVQCFAAIEQGRSPRPIVIRAADYLAEESDALNHMIRALDAAASERQRAAQRFDEVLSELMAVGVDTEALAELRHVAKTAFDTPEHSRPENASKATNVE